ncbi:zinc ABC transporter substrate-binding protein AztC [Aquibium sp. ELW1220]|uniref:zinc ABC transporter substrate-binding protein AztC n=1 Tax=Aquibium sp. ELW1220 TaxID=2976766 RepID=UPI0025B0351D|nr:zinc ABC transporter substrate-binding protein AztC [Aquibium sp. ELW1220]MDN2581165.1 zinc ABC transporter substrate-binding protein AztC [Aquibium sp. ELW1220]
MRSFMLALAGSVFLAPAMHSGAAAEPLKVVASFSIIGDLARNVGGDRIELTTLVGPNGDAHVYEPRPADAAAVARADVVLINGLHFEGFLSRLTEASGKDVPVVELTRGVTPIAMDEDGHHHEDGDGEEAKADDHGHDHAEGEDDHAKEAADGHDHDEAGHGHEHEGGVDPHAFQSVPNVTIYVRNIADAFCDHDPAGCDGYRQNAATYTARLDALDAEIRAIIGSIPQDKRRVITSHDAFGYFAATYGITFLAPEGISTEAEASATDVAALIRQIREDKASAVFVENITNTRLIEQIASETKLTIGGTLYSDALSDADGPAGTYIDLMRHNAETIAGAISGS